VIIVSDHALEEFDGGVSFVGHAISSLECDEARNELAIECLRFALDIFAGARAELAREAKRLS